MLEYLLNFCKVFGYFKGRVSVGKCQSENGCWCQKSGMLALEKENVGVSKRVGRREHRPFRVLQPHSTSEPLAASPLPFEFGLGLRGCCRLRNGSSHPP